MSRIMQSFALAMAVSIVVSFSPLHAQDTRVSVEGRVGAGFPMGDLSDAGADPGLSLGADLMYSFSPALTGYAGLSRDRFACDSDGPCSDDFVSSGFQAGLKFLLSRGSSGLPWLRAGLIGQSLDVGDQDGDLSLGVEAGAGIDLNVSRRFRLVPGAHLRAYSADLNGTDPDVRHVIVSLGGHIHF